MKKIPPALDKIVDVVLAYRPKKKAKKKRKKRKEVDNREGGATCETSSLPVKHVTPQ